MAMKHFTFFYTISYHANMQELLEVRTHVNDRLWLHVYINTIVTHLHKAFHFILVLLFSFSFSFSFFKE